MVTCIFQICGIFYDIASIIFLNILTEGIILFQYGYKVVVFYGTILNVVFPSYRLLESSVFHPVLFCYNNRPMAVHPCMCTTCCNHVTHDDDAVSQYPMGRCNHASLRSQSGQRMLMAQRCLGRQLESRALCSECNVRECERAEEQMVEGFDLAVEESAVIT